MKFRIYSAIAIACLLITGCQSNPLAQLSSNSGNANAQNETEQQGNNTHPQRAGKLPPPQIYDLQVNNRQVWAHLTQIAFAEDSIIVDLSITNGSRNAIQLNYRDGMILYDDVNKNHLDRGNNYLLAVPPKNPNILIQPGTTLQGQFVFIGRISPQANYLGLMTNSISANTRDYPRLEFKNMLIER
ncbi:MAG: hypothetical protein D6680_06635 [Cyanobacteria bacterium J007]|nr:MAG: hypothetical protein D6680_06635 [Cyanobacteria bacterium J007]